MPDSLLSRVGYGVSFFSSKSDLCTRLVTAVLKIRTDIYRSNVELILELHIDVRRSFIPNKTTFTKYCLTQWISKLHRSFEIHWVRQYLMNFTGLVGTVNTTVYKTEPILTGLGHGKLSWFSTLSLHFSIQYHIILHCFIMTPDCISFLGNPNTNCKKKKSRINSWSKKSKTGFGIYNIFLISSVCMS